MTQEEYFAAKEEDGQPILSSSLLKNAMPMWGGNAERVRVAHQGMLDKEETPGMAFGTLVHAYAEDRSRFVFEPEWEMSDKIRLIAERLYTFLTRMDTPINDSPGEHMKEFNLIADEEDWGKAWKGETRYKKFRDAALAYWLFMKESEGKIVVAGSEVDRLRDVVKAIDLAGMNVPLLHDPAGLKTYRELAIFFDMDGYKCKALLDNVVVDDENKRLVITDIKTTSKKVENFISGYGYLPNPNTGVIEKTSYSGDFIRYAYFFQEYFYKLAALEWLKQQGKEGFEVIFNYAVLETKAPFIAKNIRSSPVWMVMAKDELEGAMANVKEWYTKYNINEF